MEYAFKTSIFMQNFQEFYYEVLRQKEKALRTFEHSVGEQSEQILETTVTDIQKKLHEVLEKQAIQASKGIGGTTASYFRDAQYIMVALADETFLMMDWPGAKAWRKALMEAQIFQTQVAGEQFFKRLDVLLSSSDPARSELGQVYLMALSMGFRGRYTEKEDD
ncbi:MAG: DotU family type IV/VI secretion system protein, partial [Alphaproteobacteria bacterium]|nr:DotU family type IV/VI secretion system protein [Alphaproteobacteria bacterium]